MPETEEMQAFLREARSEASIFAGRELTDVEWEWALPRAARKLAYALDREGDADGARRQPWYLGKLAQEAIDMELFSRYLEQRSDEILAAREAKERAASEESDHIATSVYQNRPQTVNHERRST